MDQLGTAAPAGAKAKPASAAVTPVDPFPLPCLPLMVGVTGHRDLPDDPTALRLAVDEVIEQLRRKLGPDCLVLVTALAEGTEQLVADAWVDKGVPLFAIAPMPQDAYRASFATAIVRERFDRLWAAACHAELPVVDTGSGSISTGVQLEQLGLVLSRHCYALLALWDGEDGAGP